MAYLLTDHFRPSCHFSKIPAQVSLWPVRHIAPILNLRMSLLPLCFHRLEVPLVPTILVMALYKTKCFQTCQITMERHEVQNCVPCRKCFPIFGQSWLLTADPQEYPWSLQSLPGVRTAGVSLSGCTVTNWFKSWSNACASSCVCTSPFAVNTVVGRFWTFLLSINLSLILFLLIMCIDAPESTTNSSSSGLLEVTSVDIPFDFTKNIKRGFVRILELVHLFRQMPRILLGSRSPHVIFPRILARKDFAHEAHTFGQHLAMDPFIPEFWFDARCLWRCALIPTFRVHVENIFSDKNLEIHNPIV